MDAQRAAGLPVFVINLDRVPERWAFVRNQFEQVGLGQDVTRFQAVDASAADFTAPAYAPHSWRDRWELDPSEQAIFESHKAIWQKVAVDHPGGAVICEDDILISRQLPDTLRVLDLDRFGVVKLDGFSAQRRYGPMVESAGLILRPILEPVPSAACYAVSQAAARQLVAAAQEYCETLDDFVFAPRPGLTPVQLFPGVAVQGMCCVDTGLRVPGTVSQSERATQEKPRSAQKGPFSYRLTKECKRLLRRARLATGADRRLIAKGGLHARPELAADLPAYRP